MKDLELQKTIENLEHAEELFDYVLDVAFEGLREVHDSTHLTEQRTNIINSFLQAEEHYNDWQRSGEEMIEEMLHCLYGGAAANGYLREYIYYNFTVWQYEKNEEF
jgi:hypothetical protein